VKIDGVSYGNKTSYQHHGAWFAREGYCCLTLDTIQLGEIEGVHHGTNNMGMWWWLGRGYTPAGVEAWNAVRALDYLSTRPEVDMKRIGVTGRSGGGASTWWIAAIDDRPACLVPVAGITDLENHVVDGCTEGHCDCMYQVNTFGWDFPTVAAMVAPRPLTELKERSFRGWPKSPPPLDTKCIADKEADGLRLELIEFTSDENLRLPA
jgi:poly(3-hydroxybutyrate) depolymerase